MLRVPREYRSIAWVPCPRVMWMTAECMYVAQVLVPPRRHLLQAYIACRWKYCLRHVLLWYQTDTRFSATTNVEEFTTEMRSSIFA